MAISAYAVNVPLAEPLGGIDAKCASVVLIENSTGRWEELHVFHLAPTDT
jgi:hypothetical protein